VSATLNARAVDHAEHLIRAGRFLLDERDAWKAHQPSSKDAAHFRRRHGDDAHGLWFLGSDGRFPYGDYSRVHRCALLAAEASARSIGLEEIADAAARLRGLIDTAAQGEVA
jgi:hypothetical protein